MGVAEAVRNPRTYTREMVQMYRALLFDPGRFFEDFLGDRGIRTEALVVGFVGVVGSIGTMFAVLQIRSNFNTNVIGGNLPDGVGMQLWGAGIRPLLGAVVLWLAFTLAFYVLSWVFSEEGGIFETFKNTAWALVPFAFTNAILAAGYAYASIGADIPTDMTTLGGTTSRRFAGVWEPVAHDTIVIGARAAGLVFVVWSAYIAAHGIADVRNIEMRNAYAVAGVTMLGYVLWTGYNLAMIA